MLFRDNTPRRPEKGEREREREGGKELTSSAVVSSDPVGRLFARALRECNVACLAVSLLSVLKKDGQEKKKVKEERKEGRRKSENSEGRARKVDKEEIEIGLKKSHSQINDDQA